MSGSGTKICLSKRPGLSKALSRISTLLVAASTTTPVCVLKPGQKYIYNGFWITFLWLDFYIMTVTQTQCQASEELPKNELSESLFMNLVCAYVHRFLWFFLSMLIMKMWHYAYFFSSPTCTIFKGVTHWSNIKK